MTEPGKTSHRFEAQALAALEGIQVARPAQPARSERPRPGAAQAGLGSPTPAESVELITRLIECIKTI